MFFFSSAYCCKPGEFMPGQTREVVSVFCASDFYDAVEAAGKEFERMNPDVQMYISSRPCRELGYLILANNKLPRIDIIISSDPELFESFIFPDYLDWYAVFGRDELCLAFTENSRYADQINENNWNKIISREDVKIARADENLDHLGCRTLISWKLADIYYKNNISDKLFKNCPVKNIYHRQQDVFLALKTADVDYVFEYLSVSQRKSLRYIKLPEEINLRNPEFASFYKLASLRVSGRQRNNLMELKGRPITYAIGFMKKSVSKGRPKEFFKFLFSASGRAILKKEGMDLDPLYLQGNVPEEFRRLCLPKE